MDVWQEIDDLKQRIYTAYDVVSSAGGSVPSELSDCTTYNLSSAISDVVAPVQDDWRVPYKWPDIRQVLEDDPFKDRSDVQGRCVVLTEVTEDGIPGIRGNNTTDASGATMQTWGWFNIKGLCSNNAVGWRTSNDPDTYTAVQTADTQYVWDPSKYIDGPDGRKFVWIEIYYSTSYASVGRSSGYGYVSTYWPSILWICGDGTHGCGVYARFARHLEAVTGFTYIVVQPYQFDFAANLETLPPLSCSSQTFNPISFADYTALKKITWAEGGQPLSATNYSAFLNNATEIEDFPDVLFEGNQLTNINSIASYCTSIKRYPDVLDFSHIKTNAANCWNYCNYLRQFIEKFPKKMIFPDALTISC